MSTNVIVPNCFRCKTPLELRPSPATTSFFECQICHREYAQSQGECMTFRWSNPISSVLYPILFLEQPDQFVNRILKIIKQDFSQEKIERIITEIRLELNDPTHDISKTLPGIEAADKELRIYLKALIEKLEAI